MTHDIGYHVMAEERADEQGTYPDEMSIVEFLRRINQRQELPLDLTVRGLDSFLKRTDDPDQAARIMHRLLRDRVNFILNQSPVIQFVVDDVEHWDGGVIPGEETNIRLVTIFGGSMDQESTGWYAGEFNVQS